MWKLKNLVLKKWHKFIGKTPADMSMVKYWRFKQSQEAKITKAKDGSQIMIIEGEDYPFPTFPRGHLLFGHLSKLKHEIKNQIFNDSWKMLEDGVSDEVIIAIMKKRLFGDIAEIAKKDRYEMLPPEKMCPSVREIHRAWTKIGGPEIIRDYLCYILQEDDGYRNRLQWMADYLRWIKWLPEKWIIKMFDKALGKLEHGEVVGDMKERQRLLRRILMLSLKDNRIKELFIRLFREINWRKVRLTKADRYHFRGKYFKVDYEIFEY